VTYHKINEYAESVGARGTVEPFIALWVPFLLFASLILWMFYVLAFVPGGQPIGALEKIAQQMGKAVKKFISLFRRKRSRLIEQGA